MKCSRTSEGIRIQFAAAEKQLFQVVLNLYPLVSAEFFGSRSSDHSEKTAEARALLTSSLQDHQQAMEAELQKLWADPTLWSIDPPYKVWTLGPEKTEWFLQLLNDIRVGSWIRLGSPEQIHFEPHDVNPQNAPFVLALELTGLLLSMLLAGEGGS